MVTSSFFLDVPFLIGVVFRTFGSSVPTDRRFFENVAWYSSPYDMNNSSFASISLIVSKSTNITLPDSSHERQEDFGTALI